MKYILTVLLVVFSTNLFAENKPITISGMPSNAPYYYTNNEGKPDGYIPNVAKAIMDDAGLSYKIVSNTMHPMYHYNSIDERDEFIETEDLYMTGVVSDVKHSTFYYSIPYLAIEFYVLSRKGDFYCGVYDFTDKKIGVTKNNNSEARLLVYKDDVGHLPCDTLMTFPKLSVGLKKLVDGEIDYVMVSEFCLITQKHLLEKFDVEINYSSLSPLEMAIASKDRVLVAKINKSITQLKEAGTFDDLLAEHVVCDVNAARNRKAHTTIIISFIIIAILIVIISVCRYIIRRKTEVINQANSNLHGERDTLQFVTENTPMGIFIKDPKTGEVMYRNKAALDIFEVDDFFDYTPTQDVLETVKKSDEELFRTGGDITLNIPVTLISGRAKSLFVHKRLVTYSGKRCVIVMMVDYGKQISSDINSKILDLSIPLLKAFTWRYDSRVGEYVWGSGYDNKSKEFANIILTKQSRERFVHPDHRKLFSKTFDDLLNERIDTAQIKYLTNAENGVDYEWWEMYARSERKMQDGIAFMLIHGFSVNVDKQTRDEIALNNNIKELNITRLKAEESERMKSMFLANMSHEIRTPLNAIIGFSDLMPQADEEEMAEYVNIIKMNGDILINLINDILDLSKIDAGVSFNLENTNFSDLFNDLTTSLIYKQNNPEVEFIVDNPYETIMCNIDKNRIGQIITNFTTNAIKHTTKGHIKIGYTYINNVLELYVEDTGRGIPADKQHLVFQRFQKLDAITRGTGLGLSIVAAIVQHMDGVYGFESQEGIGSRFWVRIKPDVTNLGEINESEKSVSYRAIERCESSADSSKLNILVAEDIHSNYMLIAAILREHNLTHVVNGEEAVKSVKIGGFDLVLMDMMMPVMGGIEATKEIRKFNKNIPILAVTANAFEADRVAAYEAGCNGFLAKPVNKQDLIKEIEKASENSALRGGGVNTYISIRYKFN